MQADVVKIQEVVRIRERVLREMDAYGGPPATQLIRVRPDGYLLRMKWLGSEWVLSSEQDFDTLLTMTDPLILYYWS